MSTSEFDQEDTGGRRFVFEVHLELVAGRLVQFEMSFDADDTKRFSHDGLVLGDVNNGRTWWLVINRCSSIVFRFAVNGDS